jgi:hypothetical protein
VFILLGILVCLFTWDPMWVIYGVVAHVVANFLVKVIFGVGE